MNPNEKVEGAVSEGTSPGRQMGRGLVPSPPIPWMPLSISEGPHQPQPQLTATKHANRFLTWTDTGGNYSTALQPNWHIQL